MNNIINLEAYEQLEHKTKELVDKLLINYDSYLMLCTNSGYSTASIESMLNEHYITKTLVTFNLLVDHKTFTRTQKISKI